MKMQGFSQNRFLPFKCMLSVIILSGCSQHARVVEETVTEAPAYQLVNNTRFINAKTSVLDTLIAKEQKDRVAILAMQGEYKVDFDFHETVVLQAGYKRYPAKHSGAFETVLVVEDSPGHIVLQHILVVGGGHVVKHWRQDWTFEADERFEFVTDQTWKIMPIVNDKRNGAWTQCVYEVSDAPRYCGTGIWHHDNDASTWASDRTWRPLPRREYTVRTDYNALNVINRHTVTALGWTHEQDNTKTLRNGTQEQATLVREFGLNNYQRVDGYDFSPAYDYWEKTKGYWNTVRQAWAERFTNNRQVVLKTEVDGMPIINAIFAQAESIDSDSGEPVPTKSDIDKVLDQWVSAYLD